MFNSRKEKTITGTLNLAELTKHTLYIKLGKYARSKGDKMRDIKLKDLQKYLLSKWILDSLAENKQNLPVLVNILIVAHAENKNLESMSESQDAYQSVADICERTVKYPMLLSKQLQAKLSAESKSEETLVVTKTNVIRESELSSLIVDLHVLLTKSVIELSAAPASTMPTTRLGGN